MFAFGYEGWGKGWVSSCPAQLSATRGALGLTAEQETALKPARCRGGVRGRWHCCFSSPASASVFPSRKSQVHFSFLPPLLLGDFTPFSVISSIPTPARCRSAGVPRREHRPRILPAPRSPPHRPEQSLYGGETLHLHNDFFPLVPCMPNLISL